MNEKQRRFAQEYSVDHNATAAAVRAGYAESRARQTGHEMLQKPEVKQLVAKLDSEKRAELGIDGKDALEQLEWLYEYASELLPRVWKGQPVTYADPDTGEVKTVTEFRSAAVAVRALELMLRLAGLDKARSSVESFGGVVYTLTLDRDLSKESE